MSRLPASSASSAGLQRAIRVSWLIIVDRIDLAAPPLTESWSIRTAR